MQKFQLFIICLFLGILTFQDTHANINLENNTEEKTTTMKVIWDTIFIDGDISFQSYIKIPYNLEVKGDVIFWEWVTILWKISATWDIIWWSNAVAYKQLSGKNISIGNRLVAKKLVSQENMTLKGNATIAEWVLVGWNFSAGSDLKLYGNSQIEWMMKVEIDTQIFGNLYVYEDLRSKENFDFQWWKLKLYWDFRTLKKSEVIWRIYIYGLAARRSYYTNKIKYNYILKSSKYRWFMWEVDPILQYNLSDNDIKYIYSKISEIENSIEEQKRKISLFPYNYSQDKLQQEIKYLISMEEKLISFIEQYTSNHSRDIQEWKIIQFERDKLMQEFLYQYIY